MHWSCTSSCVLQSTSVIFKPALGWPTVIDRVEVSSVQGVPKPFWANGPMVQRDVQEADGKYSAFLQFMVPGLPDSLDSQDSQNPQFEGFGSLGSPGSLVSPGSLGVRKSREFGESRESREFGSLGVQESGSPISYLGTHYCLMFTVVRSKSNWRILWEKILFWQYVIVVHFYFFTHTKKQSYHIFHVSLHIIQIFHQNIARGTTEPRYWVFNLNYLFDHIKCVSFLHF